MFSFMAVSNWINSLTASATPFVAASVVTRAILRPVLTGLCSAGSTKGPLNPKSVREGTRKVAKLHSDDHEMNSDDSEMRYDDNEMRYADNEMRYADNEMRYDDNEMRFAPDALTV